MKRERVQDVLQGLEQWGISLDASMYKLLLQRCTLTKNLVEGQKVHAHMTTTGFMPDIQLSNVILNMYCKCGSLSNARQFFDAMKERDMISWTLMLGGYTKKGRSKEGFELYEQSQVAGVRCDRIMYVSIVSICASLGDVRKGKAVHTDIKKAGIATDVILESNLVHMYAKCGSMKLAHEVFDKMVERNVVSWNAMIAGLAQNGDTEEAFELFQQMQHENVQPDRITFTSLLGACASPEALKLGHCIHAKIFKAGLEADVHVGTSLVSMFAKCGSTQDARKVFDKMVVRNVVSWNAMINGYAEHGQCDDAIEIFHLMQHKGFKPNSGTFIGLLKACAKHTSVQKTGWAPARSIPAALGSDFKQGQWVHANIIQAGLETDLRVGNALINMFVKCGSIQDAQRVFDKMEVRDVISWTAMIEGYAEHGPFGKAKEVFRQMQCNGIEPDLVTFICLIKACANQASLQEARWVHSIIEVAGFGSDLRVATSMVHMYAKCGSVIDARSIFNKMDEQDLATWNAMIVGLAQHGYGREALQHFHQMILEGLCPNGLTYLGVLSACGHAGFVDEGLGYFFSMSKDYSISPTVEHFGCMVDLLGRAGELDEAEDFVNKMPQTPGAAVWGSLLGACRLHGNVRLAEVVARFLLGFDPQNAAVYVSLAHIYATANLWDKTTSLKKLMEERGIKEAGLS